MSDDEAAPSHAPLDESLAAAIRTYTNAVELSTAQKERILVLWLEGDSTERYQIAQMYPRLFAYPPFVQRVVTRLTNIHKAKDEDGNDEVRNDDRGPPEEPQDVLLLKTKLLETTRALVGDGPFRVELSSAITPTSVAEVIQLFSQQFTSPSVVELIKMIRVPRNSGTRTRRSTYGSCTWTIRSTDHNEVICAANCVVHNSSFTFIEVPLFATRSGYHKLGIARLLIAAIKDYASQYKIDYVLVSADTNAINFWGSQHFIHLAGALKGRIMTEYVEQCQEFMGSRLMVWSPSFQSDGASSSSQSSSPFHFITPAMKRKIIPSTSFVEAALAKMKYFSLEGSLSLPRPV